MVKSSALRILSVFLSEDLVDYHEAKKAYRVGPRLSAWGPAIWPQLDAEMDPAAEFDAFCEHCNMNAALSIPDGDSVLYLCALNPVPFRVASYPGDHPALHCNAASQEVSAPIFAIL